MKRLMTAFTICLSLAFVFTACDNDSLTDSVSPEKSVDVRTHAYNFTASLSGDNEVPAVESSATGQCIVKISRDEESVDFKLIVANAEDIVGAHFHMAPEGSNGPVVTFLYNGPMVPVQNGILAEGTIEAEDVVGSIEGDLDALIDAIRNEMIYVNVHSAANPSGEIRGQVD